MSSNIRRGRSFVLASFAVAACGPAGVEPKTSRHAALAADKDPSSSEWLYVTRGTQGDRQAECRTVFEILRGETKCKRAFCQPAVHLAEDWSAVCARQFSAEAPEVSALEKKLQAEVRLATLPCETEFEDLMSNSCTPSNAADCLDRAQHWATQCGVDFGTPLVVSVLSARAERATGEPVTLDTRNCGEFLAELASGLSCSNLPVCEDRLKILTDYRARCAPPDKMLPLAQALVIMAVQAAARHPAQPIRLSDVVVPPNVPVLPLADGQGGIVRVGWSQAKSFEDYVKALRAGEAENVQVARVFRSKEGFRELRLGTLPAPQEGTLGDQFPALRVQGESEGVQSSAVSVLEQKLVQATHTEAPRDAAARLLEGLAGIADLAAIPEPVRAALRASDAKLEGTCRWLAEEKNRVLSQLGDRPALVGATRRSGRLPFADISEAGNVVLGAASRAALYDANADMPGCMSAYKGGLAFLTRKVDAIKVSKADEEKITKDADSKAARCAAASQELAQTEQKIFECAFGIRECSQEEPDSLAQSYQQSAVAFSRARVEARLAVESLSEALRIDRAAKLVPECK